MGNLIFHMKTMFYRCQFNTDKIHRIDATIDKKVGNAALVTSQAQATRQITRVLFEKFARRDAFQDCQQQCKIHFEQIRSPQCRGEYLNFLDVFTVGQTMKKLTIVLNIEILRLQNYFKFIHFCNIKTFYLKIINKIISEYLEKRTYIIFLPHIK